MKSDLILPTEFLPMFRFLITSGLMLSTTSVMAQQVWTQKTELQPSIEQGTTEQPEVRKPVIPDQAFSGGTVPKWIWGNNNDSKYVLIKTADLPEIKAARIKASTDNSGTVFINGKRVGGSSEWQQPIDVDVTASLIAGKNRIEAEVANEGGAAAFVFKLVAQTTDGSTVEIVSDDSWTWDVEKGRESTDKVELRGTYGDGPWGLVFNNVDSPGRVPPGVFEVAAGFQVEKVFTVPKEELGSWVCITFDNKGRLLASDQGDLGIFRVTLPGDAEGSEAKVERVDFSKCEIKPTAAQGMLWAFDSLYFSINGGPGSGLYRATDKDGDDTFDECVKLKEFRGGGEHGPHALRLSPDGKRLFVICGNHTLPPFNPGEELTNSDYTSRVPTNWSEDHILPRMWDANGHARGIMAPGGWIASTDPDGKTWDLWSIGYRNPYDMAFNADGELFAYDADMEWDVGMPWYRPTRVVHATSGSEFGWRSGSGKWPNHYIDSLPPLVDIGPGCPVGVEFGYGTKFPARYQKALFICDWTFGTMYAIHMDPVQSTYAGVKEEFLSRTPLPLTDVAVGPDGLLYFSIGGRGTQSEVFRVRYTGSESTAPANLHDEKGAGPRSRRHVVESWHAGRSGDAVQPRVSTDVFVAGLEQDVRSGDRFLKSAAREAFYNSQLFLDLLSAPELEAADMSQGPVEDRLSIVVTLAKAPLKVLAKEKGLTDDQVTEQEEKLHGLTTKMLSRIKFSTLTVEQKLIYLRAISLVFLRLGPPTAEQREQFVADIDNSFPSKNMDLDRELCQVLIYLKSPTVIGKTVALLEAPSVPTITDNMKDLLARNRGYGGAIAASIENAPDQQQIWYAFCLRNVKEGWTMDQRKIYFSWFERAHQWAGGASYHGFLRNMETECFENASEKERLLIEASGARKPYKLPEIPKPAGPGKDWTLEEVRALAENRLKDRNFENGQKMFAATRCVICHRFAGDGGATGPDLTQLAGRFNVKDLTEAIMEPGKVISDQYKGSTVVTTSGQSYSGRIVAENEKSVTVLTNPEDPTKITEIPKSEVDEILAAKISIMPADLLKPLNQEEVLDLLAYLLSRGDKGSGMFKR